MGSGEHLLGRHLDARYRVDSGLGEGGMASVLLAHDERLDRPVVIKVPDETLLRDESFRARFQREIRSLTRLVHPRIAKVLDAGEEDGIPYAVLEYLEGGSLGDRLKARPGGREPPEELLSWLIPIAEALDFIHSEGVVHRDVKPGNILFDAHGNPFLSDFGIVKALNSDEPELTRTGQSPGSPGYMAPEILGGLIGPAYDQYSLGSLVYRALAGHAPRPFQAHVGFRETLGGLLPAQALGVLEQSMDLDPDARHPSCTEFARSFELALSEVETVVPMRDTGTVELPDREAPRRPSRPPIRRDGLRFTAIVAVVLLLAGGYLALRPGSGPEGGDDSTPPESAPLVPDGATATSSVPEDPGTKAAVGGETPTVGESRSVPPPRRGPYREETVETVERLLSDPRWASAESGAGGLLHFTHRPTGLEFVLVPGGSYRRGSDRGGQESERPVHRVVVPPFLLSRTECPQRAWDRVAGSDRRRQRGPDLPIETVTWREVRAWCDRAGLRLPSETEWEYACRAGTRTPWSCGASGTELPEYAWFDFNAGDEAHPVGTKLPNPWGFFNMHGNLREWCEDSWHGDYRGAPADSRARGSRHDPRKVARGGSWYYDGVAARSAKRHDLRADTALDDLGFRPARSLPLP